MTDSTINSMTDSTINCIFNVLLIVLGSPFRVDVVDSSRVNIIGGWSSLLNAQRKMALEAGVITKLDFECGDAGPGIF